ncbi:N-terminal double-transmembrane domain-containing protein [Shimia gijangensis]|uniref:N-terminal double-transmembrane domain-containing protein n=1 Tax=Shimia gijangensis TaxID=1470563 RepID=A0A1M6BAX3_9RHOB|nr:DUF4159 domain-containing protein [Shimia gijangensis]SHI45817.1 N-terminal double-transmembrane domain-containing protein [Shimia gijangensis]
MIAGLPIGFAAPWVLLGLIALPILWILLRAIPPAPIRRRFPGVALLLGLQDEDTVTDRTPWWLLLLRSLVLAAVIIGLAGPILNPTDQSKQGSNRLLVLFDGGWASASAWSERMAMVEGILDAAAHSNRLAAVVSLTEPNAPRFQPAATWKARLPGVLPNPWQPDPTLMGSFSTTLGAQDFDTIWLSDGLSNPARSGLLQVLQTHGDVRVVENRLGLMALQRPVVDGGLLRITAQRIGPALERDVTVQAHGLDPSGAAAVLASVELSFAAGEENASAELALPAELRARITRFEISGEGSAGAVALSDDSLQRREVALIAGREEREGLQLLSPLHYLRQALQPNAEVLEGPLGDLLPAKPDVVVMADVAGLAPSEEAALLKWTEAGGLLVRFAGPRLAASELARSGEHPLMPVRLRVGGRSVGGAMSWGQPKALAPFSQDSPFFGLQIPDEVRVSAQVVAQPDPSLASRVIAELSDGTPLVTRKEVGQGQVVLFHVTANAEWSGLPLSGLFVQMLDRLAVLSSADRASEDRIAGTIWQPVKVLDGFGRLEDGQTLPGVDGVELISNDLGPKLRPGLYRDGMHLLARNVIEDDNRLTAADWPNDIQVEGLSTPPSENLSGLFLGLALILLAADVLASLLVSGRFWGSRQVAAVLAVLLLPQLSEAQNATAIRDTREVVLGHILTGDRAVDKMAHAGLVGLSETLFFRTSVEPNEPAELNLETDELAFYPLLYWPISTDQPTPSPEAYAKLNTYLRSGGMILFDTRDADVARFGTASPNGRKLQRLAAPLDIPPLEVLPNDHVLTRTFYLLQDFPGRYDSRDVWVEAAPVDAVKIEGMPFRNLNDGVTPVVIGGNDWASAWAQDGRGNTMVPVGRGRAGERQRELAYRFGVNLVMHVLTGNYKSDQVHVPALLDRLGQ